MTPTRIIRSLTITYREFERRWAGCVGKSDQPRGNDGRWTSRGGGTLVAAIALALAVAGGAVGVGTGVVGGGSSGSLARAQGGDVAARGKAKDRSTVRATTRLVRQGLDVRERDIDAGTDCAAHSYGQVQVFFRAHPCTALFRALLEVRGQGGNVALVAVAWVDMPDAGEAAQLKALLDGSGTGNVTELSREAGRQQFSGDYYRSARDDTTVVNVQAEPVGRTRGALALARLAADNAL